MSTRASNPFTLSVASGYPKEDSVVLWTHLAPVPLSGGGMGTAGDVEIPLEIATDSSFTNVIKEDAGRRGGEVRPFRSPRGHRPPAQHALLVQVLARRVQCDRAHPDRW